jgi:hypothetical protein
MPTLATILTNLRRTWRRSLQVRMVTITVVTTGAVMLVFGIVVGSLITNGLVSRQQEDAKAVVVKNSGEALQLLESQISGYGDPLANISIFNVENTLKNQDGVDLVLVSESTGQSQLDRPPVPDALRQAVQQDHFVSQRIDLDRGSSRRGAPSMRTTSSRWPMSSARPGWWSRFSRSPAWLWSSWWRWSSTS